jgi:DNA repair exonuclease SbcCD nuclease subunit
MKFIHTADWQIGKPFAGIHDPHKRSLVQQARIEVLRRIGVAAKDAGAEFVVVAGDLFDSPSADKATVSAACSAIGGIELPVYVIPGNHDHGGPGSVWEQEFFLREQSELAPNLNVLPDFAPFQCDSAILLPCPLLRRTAATDPTDWLRKLEIYEGLPTDKPRVVLAHGSTQAFSGEWEDEEEGGSSTNLIDLSRLPDAELDYIALGDWHGTKQVGPKAWFAGTPELDRFPKGGDHDPGNILLVDVQRGATPQIEKMATSNLGWIDLAFDLADDTSLDTLDERIASLLGQRANEDLLRLSLTGSLGIEASTRLEQMLESIEARILRLKLTDQVHIAPTDSEIEALTQRASDPLIARVAGQLVDQSAGEIDTADIARIALRELHAACTQEGVS